MRHGCIISQSLEFSMSVPIWWGVVLWWKSQPLLGYHTFRNLQALTGQADHSHSNQPMHLVACQHCPPWCYIQNKPSTGGWGLRPSGICTVVERHAY